MTSQVPLARPNSPHDRSARHLKSQIPESQINIPIVSAHDTAVAEQARHPKLPTTPADPGTEVEWIQPQSDQRFMLKNVQNF